MAMTMSVEPGTNKIVSAYNPIPFAVWAKQPSPGIPCDVVYADVYFDSVYYGTYSTTVYYDIAIGFGYYHFDIQDKAQEYLKTKNLLITGTYGVYSKHYASCFVKFRETDTDASGFTVSVGSEPVKSTYFTNAVAGGATITSQTFYVLNTHQQQVDSYDLLKHLKKYTLGWYVGTDVGWMLSHRPNEQPSWNAKIGGGKYYVCENDRDMMSWYSATNMNTATLGVTVTYKNGTTSTQSIAVTSLPGGGFGTTLRRSYFFDGGVPNIKTIFPTLSFVNADYYSVYFYAFLQDFATQRYYLTSPGCCNNRIRILFMNNLGGFDGINMTLVTETNKTESAFYQINKPYIDAVSKGDRGIGRFQPSQVDIVECYNEQYSESDMKWIKELLGTSQAFIQIVPDPLQVDSPAADLIPIVILDSEQITLKKDDNFVYNISVKFSYANNVINIRS